MISEIESQIARATEELKELIDLATRFTDDEKRKCKRRIDRFDEDEAEDNIPTMTVVNRVPRIEEGLCEIAGLVNRARTELANDNKRNCAMTLGRIASAIDRELNK